MDRRFTGILVAAAGICGLSVFAGSTVEWHHSLCLSNGGYWHQRTAVQVRNNGVQSLLGAPVDITVGTGPGRLDLGGARADGIRVCRADGLEMLFAVTGPDLEPIRRGSVPAGSTLSIPVECEAGATAKYFVYFDNPAAWAVPDHLAASTKDLNGSFEKGAGSLPAGWREKESDDQHRNAWVSESPHSGKRCAKTIVSPDAHPSWVAVMKAGLPCVPGATYRFSAWVRGKDVKGHAGWYVHVLGGSKGLILNRGLEAGSDTFDWRQVTTEFKAPEDAQTITVGTVLRGTGTAWFDDVTLESDATQDVTAVVGKTEELGMRELGEDAPWYTPPRSERTQWDYRVPVRVANTDDGARDGILAHVNISRTLRGRFDAEKMRVVDSDGTVLQHYLLDNGLLFECSIPARTFRSYYLYLCTKDRAPLTEKDLERLLGEAPETDAAAFKQGSDIPSHHVYIERAKASGAQTLRGLVESGANLVKNPSFETGETLPAEWPGTAETSLPTAASFGLDTDTPFGGKCAKMHVPHSSKRDWVGWRQDVPVKPNRTYLLAGWVKTEDLQNGAVRLHAHYRDAAGKLCGAKHTSAGRNVGGTTGWTLMSGTFAMPEDIAQFQLHLTMNATGTVWHDDILLAEVLEGHTGEPQGRTGTPGSRGTFLGKLARRLLPAGDREAALAVWPVNPIVKVFREDPAPRRPEKARITVARNESEPLQLALRSSQPHEGVRIAVSPPVNRKGAALTNLEVGVVGYVPIDHPTSYYRSETPTWYRKTPRGGGRCDGWAGMWPDPLLPKTVFDLKADETQPVWVTVHVPKMAAPGDYRGSVRFSCDDGLDKSVPFTVRVWDFELPDGPSIGAIYDVRLRGPWNQPGKTREEVRNDMLRLMASRRLSADRIHVRLRFEYKNGVAACDFSDYDKAARFYFDELRMPFSYTPGFFYGFGWAHPPRKLFGIEPYQGEYPYEDVDRGVLNPEYRKAYQACLKLYWDHAKAKGWHDKIVLYISDEPHFSHETIQKQMQALCNMIHEVDPDIPIYSSTWRHCPEWDGYLDVWGVGHYGCFPTETMDARVADGDRIWFTTDGQMCTDTPYCGVERLLPYYCFKYGIQAYEFWGVDWLTYDPYEYGWHRYIHQSSTPGKYYYVRYPNGDGYLLYPGAPVGHDKPVTSVRFEQAREGVEDYEYLAILAALVEKGTAAGRDVSSARRVLDYARNLVTIPNAGGRYSSKFLPEPDIVPVLKEAAALQIESLKAAASGAGTR